MNAFSKLNACTRMSGSNMLVSSIRPFESTSARTVGAGKKLFRDLLMVDSRRQSEMIHDFFFLAKIAPMDHKGFHIIVIILQNILPIISALSNISVDLH